MKKMTGKEWKDFYNDPVYWGPEVWFEGEEITVNGQALDSDDPWGETNGLDSMEDTDIVRIAGGIVYLTEDAKDGPSLEKYFLTWRKAQTVTKILVEVRKKEAEYFKQAIKHMGGKVIM